MDDNGIPAINDRKFSSTLRLRQGEWAVVAGLAGRTDTKSYGGFPGLGSLRALGNNQRGTDRSNTLVVIKPRLTCRPPTDLPTPALAAGTETKPLSLL